MKTHDYDSCLKTLFKLEIPFIILPESHRCARINSNSIVITLVYSFGELRLLAIVFHLQASIFVSQSCCF